MTEQVSSNIKSLNKSLTDTITLQQRECEIEGGQFVKDAHHLRLERLFIFAQFVLFPGVVEGINNYFKKCAFQNTVASDFIGENKLTFKRAAVLHELLEFVRVTRSVEIKVEKMKYSTYRLREEAVGAEFNSQ